MVAVIPGGGIYQPAPPPVQPAPGVAGAGAPSSPPPPQPAPAPSNKPPPFGNPTAPSPTGVYFYNFNVQRWQPTGMTPQQAINTSGQTGNNIVYYSEGTGTIQGGVATKPIETPKPTPKPEQPKAELKPTEKEKPSYMPDATKELAGKIPLSEAYVRGFAQEQGMSDQAALETLQRYVLNPSSREFKDLSEDDKDTLDRYADKAVKEMGKVTKIETEKEKSPEMTAQEKKDYEEYKGWTAEELLHGKVINGTSYETPWGVKGTTDYGYPDWALSKIYDAQTKAYGNLKPYIEPGVTKTDISKAISDKQPKADIIKMISKVDQDIINVDKAVKAGKDSDLRLMGVTAKELIDTKARLNIESMPGKEPSVKLPRPMAESTLSPEGNYMVAEMMVPGVYTVRHWNELGTAGKAISIAIDVASVALPIGLAAVAGARAVATAGRTARLAGALRGAGAGAEAVIRGPVDMFIHPLETAKGTAKLARNIAEVIAGRSRLPFYTVGVTDSTVRYLVRDATTPEEALAIRQKLMSEAIKTGKTVYVDIGEQRITLNRSALTKELGGGASHAGPSNLPFKEPLEVLPKVGKPAAEQGLFVSHEPLPRFAESAAFPSTAGSVRDLLKTGSWTVAGMAEKLNIPAKDVREAVEGLATAKEINAGKDGFYTIAKGNTPVIYIMSKETAAKTLDTGKIYKGPEGAVVEMERKLPVGAKTTGPQQILWTRIGSEGTKTAIYLEKPLSRAQIVKLKAMGIVEMARTPFKPAIEVTGEGKISILRDKQIAELEKILGESGNTRTARNLGKVRAAFNEARAIKPMAEIRRADLPARKVPPSLERITGLSLRNPSTRAAIDRVTLERAPARTERVPERETPERAGRREEMTRIEARRGAGRDESGHYVSRTERATREERGRTERTERVDRAERAIRTERTTRAERMPPRETTPRIERAIRKEPPPKIPRTPRNERLLRVERLLRIERLSRISRLLKSKINKNPQRKELSPEEIKTAVAWRMGALGKDRKPVTIALTPTGKKVTYVGSTPAGLKVAPNELGAKKTIQLLRKGDWPKEVNTKIGFQNVTVRKPTSKGQPGAISFRSQGTGLRSTRKGQIYLTPVRGGTLLSRRPLSKGRR